MSKPYAVCYTDKNVDNIWNGSDYEYATKEEAMAAYSARLPAYYRNGTELVVLDGPDVYLERANPDYQPTQVSRRRTTLKH